MPIELSDYIPIEERLQQDIRALWEEVARPRLKPIIAAVRRKDYDSARRLIGGMDVQSIAGSAEMYVRRSAFLSMVFGASLVVRPKDVAYRGEAVPDVIESQVALWSRMFERLLTQILEDFDTYILDAELRKTEESCCERHQFIEILKAADVSVAEAMNAIILKQGGNLIDITANLSTSRLVGLGFLDHAMRQGYKEYQITSALDDRVCPVCQTTHGKTFIVEDSFNKTLEILKHSDPDTLKAMAPWPSQSKANVDQLRAMDNSLLQKSGLDILPLHPGCRCRQVLKGTVPAVEVLPVIPLDSLPLVVSPNMTPEQALKFAKDKLGKTKIDEATGVEVAKTKIKKAPKDFEDKVVAARLKVMDASSNPETFGLLKKHRSEVSDFDPRNLVSDQREVMPPIVAQYLIDDEAPPISIYKYRNRFYLSDGNHRANAALIAERTMRVFVEDLDAALKEVGG